MGTLVYGRTLIGRLTDVRGDSDKGGYQVMGGGAFDIKRGNSNWDL